MAFEPKDSLRATFWGLFFIWWAGGVGTMLALGKPMFGLVYAIALGPVLYLIYRTAKMEMEEEMLRQQKQAQKAKAKAKKDG